MADGVLLGSGWPARQTVTLPPAPSEQELLLERLIAELRGTLGSLPAPHVTVEPQDLSDIVTAVQSLSGPAGPTANEIALAIRDVLAPTLAAQPDSAVPMSELVETLKMLDFRMKGIGHGGVGGTVATISNDVSVKPAAGTTAFPVTVTSGVITANLSSAPEVEVFGAALTGSRNNQIEVHFDDTNWATYGTETHTGGAPVGSQSAGRVAFTSGTGANGHYQFLTTDVAKYRPLHEVYGAATARFVTPPTNAADTAYVGLLGDPTVGNWVAVGYKGTSFGISYYKAGAEVAFVPQASWDLTGYTLAGVAQTFDPSDSQIYMVECGLLGYAGFTVKVFSPDHTWATIYTFNGLNTAAEPVFSNFDLYQFVDIAKSASDTTNITVHSACWAAGTTTSRGRISDPLSDRSLADTSRSVIWGKATNGSYVAAGMNNQGRLLVSNDAVGTDGAAVPTGTTLVAGTDGTNAQTLKVATDGTLAVSDQYANGEVLADQTGAGAVLTFTFANTMDLIWVRDTGAVTTNVSRVDPFGGTPSASAGIPLPNNEPIPITRQTTTVKVYAPAGSTISAWGYRK